MSTRFLDKRIAWNLKSEIQKFPIPKECDKIKREVSKPVVCCFESDQEDPILSKSI
jgi:hypothetical protein